MQELEKILEEIEREENVILSKLQLEVSQRSIDEMREYLLGMRYTKDIIRKHMNDRPCSECSRRKFYQVGYRDGKNDGWIPVEERLPEEPKENPVFDGKALELYLVDIGGSVPIRAFWNGKQFTDGLSVLKVIAWQPLPSPYRPERSEE